MRQMDGLPTAWINRDSLALSRGPSISMRKPLLLSEFRGPGPQRWREWQRPWPPTLIYSIRVATLVMRASKR